MTKFAKFGATLLFGLAGQTVLGQINESDTLLLQHASALTGSLQTGNIEAVALRLKADVSLAPAQSWAFKTQNSFRYQEFFSKKADNDFYSRNFLYLWQQRRIYPFAMAFVSTNFRRKIDFRYFAGAGATWQLVRRPGHTMKTALSGVYESTRFAASAYNYPEYDGSEKIETWRVTSWLFGKHALINKHLRLYYEAFVQPSLERSNNFRWQTEIGLEWPFWRGLSFTANYVFTHENVVVSNVKQDDRLLTFGVAYSGKIR
jgi:hypothetical protein